MCGFFLFFSFFQCVETERCRGRLSAQSLPVQSLPCSHPAETFKRNGIELVLNSRVKAVSADAVTVVDKADQVRSCCALWQMRPQARAAAGPCVPGREQQLSAALQPVGPCILRALSTCFDFEQPTIPLLSLSLSPSPSPTLPLLSLSPSPTGV